MEIAATGKMLPTLVLLGVLGGIAAGGAGLRVLQKRRSKQSGPKIVRVLSITMDPLLASFLAVRVRYIWRPRPPLHLYHPLMFTSFGRVLSTSISLFLSISVTEHYTSLTHRPEESYDEC